MERTQNNNVNNANNDHKLDYVIDVFHILNSLLRRAWIILLVSVLSGVITLLVTVFFITPKYSSSIMLYVNNKQNNNPNNSISSSELSAAMQLVESYIVILESQTTLDKVIALADVPYSYSTLKGMINAEAVNETEIFRVTVTSTDPEEAKLIADAIAKVLPDRVASIMDGSSMRIVDGTSLVAKRVSPNVAKNTVIGVIVGFLISCGFFVVLAILDDTIRNEDAIIQNYEMPILAKIPNLAFEEAHGRKNNYYSYYSGYGKHTDNNADKEVSSNEEK